MFHYVPLISGSGVNLQPASLDASPVWLQSRFRPSARPWRKSYWQGTPIAWWRSWPLCLTGPTGSESFAGVVRGSRKESKRVRRNGCNMPGVLWTCGEQKAWPALPVIWALPWNVWVIKEQRGQLFQDRWMNRSSEMNPKQISFVWEIWKKKKQPVNRNLSRLRRDS